MSAEAHNDSYNPQKQGCVAATAATGPAAGGDPNAPAAGTRPDRGTCARCLMIGAALVLLAAFPWSQCHARVSCSVDALPLQAPDACPLVEHPTEQRSGERTEDPKHNDSPQVGEYRQALIGFVAGFAMIVTLNAVQNMRGR